MNIDVKNAFDNINIAYSELENSEISKEALSKATFSFINNISTNNFKERYDCFSRIYLGGNFTSDNFIDVETDYYKALIDIMLLLDSNNHAKSKVLLSRLLLSFYTILGQHYLSSPYDKYEIDRAKYIQVINNLNSIVEKETERVQTMTSNPENSKSTAEKIIDEPEETLEELIEKLDSLIGLEGVKEEVNNIINLIKVQKKGEDFGESQLPLSLHLVFYGNPGTGKTTVARLLAKIYRSLGVLSKGQTIEVDRSKLVAGYVGQTAIKTQEVIDQALGGILFIDEAYTLTHEKGDNDFGQESVDTILKAMEDNRDDLIVIVAGYPKLMKEFIMSNPGLKSRFNIFINFEDYLPDELLDIFKLHCQEHHFILADGCDDFLGEYFNNLYNNHTEEYANGRDVRNYFENVIKAQANRLSPNIDNITHDEYLTITVEDLNQAKKMKTII